MNPYNLPTAPADLTPSNIVIRLIDGLIARYANATKEVPQSIAEYKVCESSMSITKVYRHIYQLAYWTTTAWNKSVIYNKSLLTLNDYRIATLDMMKGLREYLTNLNDDQLQSATLYLKRTDSYFPFWYIINGPLSDMLTHVGQVNTWRRAAGYPCPEFSPLYGQLSE